MNFQIDDPLEELPVDVRQRFPEEFKKKYAENQKVRQSLADLAELFITLNGDILKLAELEAKDPNPVWARAIYRAAFAWIEGVVYRMKMVALTTQEGDYQAKFSREEIALLLEEKYVLDDQGRADTKDNWNKIDKNLRFTYAMMAKGFGITTKLNVSGKDNNWANFKKAIEIRDRLTHPKDIKDISITFQDRRILAEALKWFYAEQTRLLNDIRETFPLSKVHPILPDLP